MACFFVFLLFEAKFSLKCISCREIRRKFPILIVQDRIAEHENLLPWPPLSLNTFKTIFDGMEINEWLFLWVDNLNHRVFGLFGAKKYFLSTFFQ